MDLFRHGSVVVQVPNASLTSSTGIIVGPLASTLSGNSEPAIPRGAVLSLALLVDGPMSAKWPHGTRCATMIFADTACIFDAGLLVRLLDKNTGSEWWRSVCAISRGWGLL